MIWGKSCSTGSDPFSDNTPTNTINAQAPDGWMQAEHHKSSDTRPMTIHPLITFCRMAPLHCPRDWWIEGPSWNKISSLQCTMCPSNYARAERNIFLTNLFLINEPNESGPSVLVVLLHNRALEASKCPVSVLGTYMAHHHNIQVPHNLYCIYPHNIPVAIGKYYPHFTHGEQRHRD